MSRERYKSSLDHTLTICIDEKNNFSLAKKLKIFKSRYNTFYFTNTTYNLLLYTFQIKIVTNHLLLLQNITYRKLKFKLLLLYSIQTISTINSELSRNYLVTKLIDIFHHFHSRDRKTDDSTSKVTRSFASHPGYIHNVDGSFNPI